MNYKKVFAVFAGLVVSILIAGWFLRNTIIERISNPLLAQYGLTITDVSLDALANRDASISKLELRHQSGALLNIRNLTLPIRNAPDGFRTYSAEMITVEMPASDAADSPGVAIALQQFLALPDLLPDVRVTIDTLTVSNFPEFRNVRWLLENSSQEFSLLIDSHSIAAIITRSGSDNYLLDVTIANTKNDIAAQSASVAIRQSDLGFALTGSSQVDLPFWMPLANLFGLGSLDISSGTADLQFDVQLPIDPLDSIKLFADLTPLKPVRMAPPSLSGALASAELLSAESFEITASFPSAEWFIRQAAANVLLSYPGLPDVLATITNQTCQSGPRCSGDVQIVLQNAALPFADVGELTLLATQELTLDGDNVIVGIAPNASLRLAGVTDNAIEARQLTATFGSGATLNVAATAWQFLAESIDLQVTELSPMDGVSYSGPLFLDGFDVSVSEQTINARAGIYATASEVAWGERRLAIPAFSGGISRQNSEVAVIVNTDGLLQNGQIEIAHNLESNNGGLSVRDALVAFDTRPVSDWLSPWPNDWDIAAGTLGVDLQSNWRRNGEVWQVTATNSLKLSGIAGAYKDIAFAGLAMTIDTQFSSASGIAIAPVKLGIELVEIGLPIESITADLLVHVGDESFDVRDLSMQVLGGVVSAQPFSYGTGRASNTLILHAESIDLARVVSMQEFESIEVSGRIGADLPVTIEDDKLTIRGGTLSGAAPGGIIRYLPGRATPGTDVSALGIATRALSNFEYDTLTSAIDYTTDGDLKLQMRLSGRNPDLEGNRPVVLNLGVENNVPQMLRSLRAARAVQEILERRLAQ